MSSEVAKKPVKQYLNTTEISKVQHDIMVFVDFWVHKQRLPTPQKEIVLHMNGRGIPKSTTIKAIKSLLKKKYLRKAITISSSSRSYVQLRRV